MFLSYIPPNSSLEIYEAHINNIKSVFENDLTSYGIILGDFNLCHIQWIYSLKDKCLFPSNLRRDFESVFLDSLVT